MTLRQEFSKLKVVTISIERAKVMRKYELKCTCCYLYKEAPTLVHKTE